MKVGILPILGILVLSLVGIGIPETIEVYTYVWPYISVTFSYDTIYFGAVSINTYNKNVQSYKLSGNGYEYFSGALNVTITTNNPYVLEITKNAFTPRDLTLKFAKTSYDEPQELPTTEPTDFTTLPSGYQVGFLGIFTGAGDYFDYHYYRLDVGFVESGPYTTTLTITYANIW